MTNNSATDSGDFEKELAKLIVTSLNLEISPEEIDPKPRSMGMRAWA